MDRHLLQPDESILWEGKPRPGVHLQKNDAFLIPFSILWFGFIIVWETVVIRWDAPIIFPLWGIPFILVGLYVTIGRFFVDAAKKKHIDYAVTDKRVFIIDGKKTSFITYDKIPSLDRTVKKDGSGSIYFTTPSSDAFDRSLRRLINPGNPHIFNDIDDVERVYRIIEDQML